ncbi:MAG: aspartate aminotransferase family protein [Thiohalocapsa sp.]|uniref:aspartate aminotransferase family protein n=1 Tax=Thiohalocapsa sp. TaxID=2497641 RepID=UPI0025F7EAF2|nr:aspartate aminotransferase family protein [Thiohalocapsa sp.]MCG6941050.1 aspartate aminotransferase family protein [Thiohalocapsa sp.]
MTDHLMATYNRLPISFERGEGAWLWSSDGKRYLDALAGIAVCGLGHAHPGVRDALCEQAGRLLHVSNLYQIPAQSALGDRLCAAAGMDRVFFANSGAEANEAAIKLARLFASRRGVQRPEILVMENSFHGRTLATLTATGNRKAQAGFEPLVSGFLRVPYDDLAAVETAAANRTNITAVLVESIQGEGGVVVPQPGYLAGLRALCDRNGWLLMLDEVQSGMGRSGELFAFQHEGIVPDVMTLAKGLGNGVPIGACLARGEAAEVLGPGTHGSTFGGNPLACRAAMAVLDALAQDDLPERAAQLGERIRSGLHDRLADAPGVTDIRGRGLLIGIELDRPCGELVAAALAEGLLINVTAQRVVRLLPPLIIDDEQAQQIIDTVARVVLAFLDEADGGGAG